MHVAMLVCFGPLLGFPSIARAQHYWGGPPLPKPHPVLWRVLIKRVDVLAGGQPLRWKDGDCPDDKATGTCITRIYMLPAKTGDVHLACSYQYEMKPGYATDTYGYRKIPTHAPYMQHWSITLKDETANRSIASLWSAQPMGHVYAHMHITYDSNGKVAAKYIDYRNPDQLTCDQKHFSDCYWDVDPRHLQVVQASWHPTPGDHVLRCTLHPLHDAGWYPSPQPISRIKVHVPHPPKQRANATSLEKARPAVHPKQGERPRTTPTTAPRGGFVSTGPSVQAKWMKPKLAIRTAAAALTRSCDPKRLVAVRFTVVNEGGRLVRKAADLAYIQVRDSAPGTLQSVSMGLPDLAHGQAWSHTLVLGTRARLDKLPGEHRLVLYTGPSNAIPGKLSYVPAAPYRIRLNVPAGYCQVRRPDLSPAKMHLGGRRPR